MRRLFTITAATVLAFIGLGVTAGEAFAGAVGNCP